VQIVGLIIYISRSIARYNNENNSLYVFRVLTTPILRST